MKWILAIDQGTTSSRAILFNHQGDIGKGGAARVPSDLPSGGLGRARSARNLGIAVGCSERGRSNLGGSYRRCRCHRDHQFNGKRRSYGSEQPVIQSTMRSFGKTVGTAGYCDQLRSEGRAEEILTKTGLVIDAYFSATKIKWILDQVPGAREKAERGELAFGTIDTWLLWKLTDGAVHLTDPTNASRTMLFHLEKRGNGMKSF